MVTYNLLKELKNQGLFDKCISTGIISYTYASWYNIYEFYKNERLTETSKMQCYTNTATHFKLNERTIIRVVSRFED